MKSEHCFRIFNLRMTPIHLWKKTAPHNSRSISEGLSKNVKNLIHIKNGCPINGSQSTNLELFTEIFFPLKVAHGLGELIERELSQLFT